VQVLDEVCSAGGDGGSFAIEGKGFVFGAVEYDYGECRADMEDE